ncbi:MAG: PEP-CTERM sorting domain-containing protein [Candidatus Hydrogenedentes bacterium]|nr:PEP-CTERM sorting domain-containing protein [Candidatus Hydrogenedentota bacterium]
MIKKSTFLTASLTLLALLGTAFPAGATSIGPYSGGVGNPNDPNPFDEPIPGFVGPDGDGRVTNNNYVNPAFVAWATGYLDYLPAPGVSAGFQTPERFLGPVTGDNFDIVSLGDLNQSQIDAWLADPENNPGPGQITLTFESGIGNGAGADFAIFENGFFSNFTIPETGSVEGMLFGELAYVEVSSNGVDFARFDSHALQDSPVGAYGSFDPTGYYNLAGKHANAYGQSWGTPFDLATLSSHSLVLDGRVDLNNIGYVRLIDIPGSGNFLDAYGNAIYDAWVTWGSGGADLEAIGVLNAARSSAPVPEPATLTLLAMGAAFLARRARSGN